jgi:pimeloyl-ACP methyl ester carboxylesterase
MATTKLRFGNVDPAGAARAARTDGSRRRLLATIPATERRLEIAGISTAVLEGGDGPPVVLLHGPMACAGHWLHVIPDLVRTHRVIAPDLPGHGASEVTGELDADRVLAWLGALIEQTSGSPPALVGQLLGGAIAARLACHQGQRLSRLVLVDTLGLRPFEPAPDFGLALAQFLGQPTEQTHRALWRHCAFDLDRLLQRMGNRWEPFEAYNLDRARTPAVQSAVSSLMAQFGMPAIPSEDLARINIPTSLIWGRHDRATPVSAAEAASERFGWPLSVIENCADDPPVEQPEALLQALRVALGNS